MVGKDAEPVRERLWNKDYNKVMLTNFTLFFSFYLLTPLLPIYLAETYHSTKDVIGLVLSGYTVVALFARPFSGFLADSFPRKHVLMVCLLLYFVFFGGYLLAGSMLWFAIVRTLHGAPFGASTVANSTMAIDVLPASRRSEGIGFYGISNNLASAIAPTVSLWIYHTWHRFDILFWLCFVVSAIGFVAASTVHARERQVMGSRAVVSLDRFFLLKGWYMAVSICLYGFCWGVLSNYLGIYSKEHLGESSSTGTFFLLLSAGLILSRLVGNRSLREGKLMRNAVMGTVLSTVGYVIFIAWPTMVGYYGAAILIGLGNGHIWPAFQNMIIGIARPNERGTANSTLLTSWDLGMGLGILLGGVVAEHLCYDATFWTIAIVHVAGLAWLLYCKYKKG